MLKQQKNALLYDHATAKIVACIFFLTNLNVFIQYIFPDAVFFSKYNMLIIGGIYIFYLIKWENIVLPQIGVCLLLWELVALITLLISILRNPSASYAILFRCAWTLGFGIPCAILAFFSGNTQLIITELTKVSWFVLLFAISIFLKKGSQYNMSFGYMLLPVILLHINLAYRNIYIWPIVCFEYVILLLYGSRGAFISTLPFFIMRGYIEQKASRKWLYSMTLLFLGSGILFFSREILQYVGGQLAALGISSRTLRLLTRGDLISHSSGREYIYYDVLSKIQAKPAIGWGVAGELTFMKSYPHNVFLEVCLHYGIVLGGIICIMLSWMIIRMAKIKTLSVYHLYCLCVGVIPLMISGTYLQKPEFFIFISLSLVCVKKTGGKIF